MADAETEAGMGDDVNPVKRSDLKPGDVLRLDNLARSIEQALNWPKGKLNIEGVYGIVPGKSSIKWTGTPALSPDEEEQVRKIMFAMNKAMGGSPPIVMGEA